MTFIPACQAGTSSFLYLMVCFITGYWPSDQQNTDLYWTIMLHHERKTDTSIKEFEKKDWHSRVDSPLSQWDWLSPYIRCSHTVWRFLSLSSNMAETTGADYQCPSHGSWWWPRKWRRACWRPNHWKCPETWHISCQRDADPSWILFSIAMITVPVHVKPERSFVQHHSPGCF